MSGMREADRRLRVIEKARRDVLFDAAIPRIGLEDAEWLLSLPTRADGTGWDLPRFTAEQVARAEAILGAAMALTAIGEKPA